MSGGDFCGFSSLRLEARRGRKEILQFSEWNLSPPEGNLVILGLVVFPQREGNCHFLGMDFESAGRKFSDFGNGGQSAGRKEIL